MDKMNAKEKQAYRAKILTDTGCRGRGKTKKVSMIAEIDEGEGIKGTKVKLQRKYKKDEHTEKHLERK